MLLTCHLKQRRSVLAALAAVGLLLLTISGAFAFADTYITAYNLSTSDPTYGPFDGSIWASNVINGTYQYLQAENDSIAWTSAAATRVDLDFAWVAPTFHVFQYGTANCAAPYDYDGYFESSQADAWVQSKNATCSGGDTWPINEARVTWPAGEVTSSHSFYGGAEFAYHYNGSAMYPYTGKVSNDIYFGNISERKDQIGSGTWCFDSHSNPNLWRC
ncbi:MAG: hypothetical protein M1570_16480 [Chloroflexi bacterium]|nr:hypothetical protein [Chloroflexota bacterium]